LPSRASQRLSDPAGQLSERFLRVLACALRLEKRREPIMLFYDGLGIGANFLGHVFVSLQKGGSRIKRETNGVVLQY